MGEVVAGRFDLIDLLGSGGAGSVWRAWDRRERRYLAAKVLRHSDSDSIMRFIREARTIIEHEHVLVPRNWVGEDDRVLFTTDLVRGGSVAALVSSKGPLPERWVAEIARQTALALDSIHSNGFVHRDVKPANLLLEPTGRGRPHVWLSDFGIATTLDAPRLTATHLVLGTPGYLSLEAYHGALPAPAQDMWALGAVLRNLATGITPPPATEAEVWKDAGPTWPLSPALAALTTALLDPDPAKRPSAGETVRRLDALLAVAPPDSSSVEITDQVGLPPQGWGPDGPVGGVNSGGVPTEPMGYPPFSGPQSGDHSGGRHTGDSAAQHRATHPSSAAGATVWQSGGVPSGAHPAQGGVDPFGMAIALLVILLGIVLVVLAFVLAA